MEKPLADKEDVEPVAGKQPVPAHNHPTTNQSLWKEVITTLLLLVVAIFIALFTKAYIVQPYVVDGQSMENTLQNGNRLLVDKLPVTIARIDGHPYVPKRGNIIVFNQSNLPGYSGTKQLIKRVIGLPGERVVVSNGLITIYNSTHPAGFNPDTSGGYHIGAATTPGNVDVTLSNNELFVCGDNRPNSEDSRYFGPIKLNQIVGKLSFRIFPLSEARHF